MQHTVFFKGSIAILYREPIRARYSQQFVDKLVEKRRKEEEERKGDEEKQMKYK